MRNITPDEIAEAHDDLRDTLCLRYNGGDGFADICAVCDEPFSTTNNFAIHLGWRRVCNRCSAIACPELLHLIRDKGRETPDTLAIRPAPRAPELPR